MQVLTDPKTGAVAQIVRSDVPYLPRLSWVVAALALLLGVVARLGEVGATLMLIIAVFWIWVVGLAACWATGRHPHRLVLLAVPPLLISLAVGLVAVQSRPTPQQPRSQLTQPVRP